MKNFNWNTFSGRLLGGFAILGVLNIVFLLVILTFSNGILESGSKVVEIYQPAELALTKIESALHQTSLAMKSEDLSTTEKETAIKALYNEELRAAKEDFAEVAQKWDQQEIIKSNLVLNELLSGLMKSQLNYVNEQDKLVSVKESAEGFYVSSYNKYKDAVDAKLANFQDLKEQVLSKQKQGIAEATNSVYTLQNSFQLVLLLLFVSTLVFGLLFSLGFTKRFKAAIDKVSERLELLGKGDFPDELPDAKNEFGPLSSSINSLISNLKNVQDFAQEVGQGNFETNIAVFNNKGELGTSLAGMRTSLQTVSDNDKKRNWSTKGLAEFSNILRQSDKNLEELSYEIISNLVKYLGANQGGIFILDKEDENTSLSEATLNLEACYAYERRKFKEAQIAVGEGLVGQCVLEGETIYMTAIPENYVRITSGLGEATPSCLLIVPLKVNDEIFGVVEIASFKEFEDYQISFVEELGESIASTISGVKINERTAKLLEESQRQSEAMRAQEEEMRQNMEELQATQEEMERKTKEIERIRDEEKRRADEEVERLNEVMSDYMNNFHNEKTQLKNKIQELESQLAESQGGEAEVKS